MNAILLSPEDQYLLSLNWYVDARGYLRRTWTEDGKTCSEVLHRVILAAPPRQIVDHANGNTLDNRRENLRFCTHAENMRNRKTSRSNKLGIKGVYLDKGRYRARIKVDGRCIQLGSFGTAEQAAKAYGDAAVRLHGEFARLA